MSFNKTLSNLSINLFKVQPANLAIQPTILLLKKSLRLFHNFSVTFSLLMLSHTNTSLKEWRRISKFRSNISIQYPKFSYSILRSNF